MRKSPGDLRRQSAGQRHEAIGARIRAHANAPRERTALREAAGVLVGLQPREACVDRVRERLERAHVEVLARTARLRRVQADGGRQRRHVADLVAGHAARDPDRFVVDVTGGEHRPAHRVDGEVGRLPVAVRAVLPEVRDRGQHDPRVHRRELVVAEPERVERAGRETLDHPVGAGDEVEQPFTVRRALEIEDHAALVGVEEQERPAALRSGRVGGERRQRPRRIARGRLDLDDLRTVVGEQPRAERPHRLLREVDDAQPVERQRHRHAAPLAIAVRRRADHRGSPGMARSLI